MSAEIKVISANFLERFMNKEIIAVAKSPRSAKIPIRMNCAVKNPPSSRSPKIPAIITIRLKRSETLPRKKNGIAKTIEMTGVTINVSSPNKIAIINFPFGCTSGILWFE